MINYSPIIQAIKSSKEINASGFYSDNIIPQLVTMWLDDYSQTVNGSEITEITINSCSYLFDYTRSRLIAAWGISHGKSSEVRDKSRMSGHPLGSGKNYHRGHVIPHSMGGGTDINLVPQLGSLNIGSFRVLEKKAIATPGALYFTYWKYSKGQSQKPSNVDQGFLYPGKQAEITTFNN